MMPIKLEGDNLGQRHRHLNQLVNEAFSNKVPFDAIKDLQEYSDVDRLFKIDLANKYRLIDYILENVRSDDMLFVSRALQSTWLLTDVAYEDVINPVYLHEQLFPNMIVPAVNKTMHKIEKYLKDERRCQIFYEFYKSTKLKNEASKYLPKCSAGYIMEELKELNPDPHMLKLLCEKNPNVAEYYFSNIIFGGCCLATYHNHQESFLTSVKFLMKINPDVYFNILEKFNLQGFKRLSERATHFVMKSQMHRFRAKSELYAAWFLDLTVVAKYLNDGELKELITKLAGAEYLGSWFSYKTVEPLLKRLCTDGKSDFVRSIFVDKSFGMVKETPYEFPKAPELEEEEIQWPGPKMMAFYRPKKKITKRCIKRKVGCRSIMVDLYDVYRFVNFPETFFELQKKIQREPDHTKRQIMLTVLITKSKNSEQHTKQLLDYFLSKHLNEPNTLKCSFVRTIVKQATAYKFNIDNWNSLEQIFHNIGVFTECEEDITSCIEAIIIHCVLNNQNVPDVIVKKYLKNMTKFDDCSLTMLEKAKIFKLISHIVLNQVESFLEANEGVDGAINHMWELLHLIDVWKISRNDYTTVLDFIKRIVEKDAEASESLLLRAYENKRNRQILFKEIFVVKQDLESYINVLKHDSSLLVKSLDVFYDLLKTDSFKHDRFLFKIITYFHHDLAYSYLERLRSSTDVIENHKFINNFARCTCILKSDLVNNYIKGETKKQENFEIQNDDIKYQKTIINNLFLLRPPVLLNTLIDLQRRAIVPLTVILYRQASSVCRDYIPDLLKGSKSFVKLAVRLSFNKLDKNEILENINKIWELRKSNKIRLLLLKEIIKYICNNFSNDLWVFLKVLIENLNAKQNHNIFQLISDLKNIPDCIKAEYCRTAYVYLTNAQDIMLGTEYREDIVDYINENIDQFETSFVDGIIQEFLRKSFSPKIFDCDDYRINNYNNTTFQLISRYLLACRTPGEQERRYEVTAKPFMDTIKLMWYSNEKDFARTHFHQFLTYLNYYMDIKWADPTPIFVKIVKEMEDVLPFYHNFGWYARIRMSMARANAIIDTIDRNHERNKKYLIQKLSHNLGKYVSLEVDKLCIEYNLTVQEMVGASKCFSTQFSMFSGRDDFLLSITEGSVSNQDRVNGIIFAIEFIASEIHNIRTKNLARYFKIIKNIRAMDNLEVNMFLNAKLTEFTAKQMQ